MLGVMPLHDAHAAGSDGCNDSQHHVLTPYHAQQDTWMHRRDVSDGMQFSPDLARAWYGVALLV